MSVSTPENYVYGTVVGRFLSAVLDGDDADRFPDVVPATGTVKIVPAPKYYKNLALPATFFTHEHIGTIDGAGYLVDHRGSPGIVLMSPTHQDISPSGWTYKVTMTINGVQLPPFDLPIGPGETVDLTTAMPAVSSGGVVTIVTEASRIAAEAARDQAVAAAEGLLEGLDAAIEAYLDENPPQGGGAVDSVAGKVGVVVLSTSDVQGLDTALAGKATLDDAAVSTTSTWSSNALVSLGLDDTGTNDIGPRLQELYDSGRQKVTLRRGGTYRLDTPVFLDSPNFGDKFELDLNGATLTLGSGLPTLNGAFPVDETVRAAFLVNTNRVGLSAGNVDVQANRSTTVGASLRFVARNGRVSAGANNVILAFGNRCGAMLENINLYGGRALWSWYDYGEPHILRNCHFQTAGASQPSDAYLLHGVAKGDGVKVESIKCDGAVGGVSLRECFGAVIDSAITSKLRFIRCSGIVVNAAHMESDIYESYAPNIEVYNSDVKVIGGAFYPPQSVSGGCIEIDDSDTNNNLHSTVSLLGAEAKYLGKGDAAQGSLVRIKAVNTRNNTTVVARDITAKTSGVSGSGAGTWRATALAPVTSDVAAVQTALAAGAFQLASGSFEVGRVDGNWLVYEPGSAGWRRSRALTSPTFTQIVNATDVAGGTLTQGTTYEYAVAAVDGEGNYTSHSVSSYSASTAQANRILLNNTKNMAVILWRKVGTGVATAPDAYVVLPSVTNNLVLFDQGVNVSGRPWVTATVPIPGTVAASNTTRARALVGASALTSTKADVGLDNVDNTSDANKPISSAVAAALAGKASTATATTSATGLVELATTAETTTGTDSTRAVTPAGLKAVADTKAPLNAIGRLLIAATAKDTWPTRAAYISATAPGFTGKVEWDHGLYGPVTAAPPTILAGDVVTDLLVPESAP